ncbi:peptidoglycan editing factor PgeF [Herbaspirillum sp. RV1423]|uniref:peptidoglycan editing factor PgeF n=1 Tax=Herbaspirillum sp. RV1423 TaxID=1443993 RepID=UPI0004B31FEA|nr:peptidoglycan editing factor PgeF [Herbaspirillum sp. RV1423]
MELLIPDWKDIPGNVGALATLRQGGFSQGLYGDGQGGGGLNLGVHVQDDLDHVRHNRSLLRSILPSEPTWLTQVHGVDVADAAEAKDAPEADASIASKPGAVCVMMTADCLPVLFCDTAGRVVGAAHAGWRGLAAGVLENTVAAMRRRGADEIQAWLGPAIGPQQFEVGQDVLDAFVAHDVACSAAFVAIAGRDGKYLADIYQLARRRLAQVDVQRVAGGGFCTVSDRRFYSYRRDKLTGRMASMIWLR